MSALESHAQPILTPMLQDQPRALTAVEQHIIATWATKTMLTMQGTNIGGERVVSLDRYHWFCGINAVARVTRVALSRYTDRTRWPLWCISGHRLCARTVTRRRRWAMR